MQAETSFAGPFLCVASPLRYWLNRDAKRTDFTPGFNVRRSVYQMLVLAEKSCSIATGADV